MVMELTEETLTSEDPKGSGSLRVHSLRVLYNCTELVRRKAPNITNFVTLVTNQFAVFALGKLRPA